MEEMAQVLERQNFQAAGMTGYPRTALRCDVSNLSVSIGALTWPMVMSALEKAERMSCRTNCTAGCWPVPPLCGQSEPRGFEALFLNQKGGRLSDRSVRSIVKKYCLQADTKEIVSPHGFRHSFASHLLDNGADLRVVQELLGHKKISSTQIYTHVSRSKLRKVYQLAHPRA